MAEMVWPVNDETQLNLEKLIDWQCAEDERARAAEERRKIAAGQRTLDNSMTELDQRVFGIVVDPDYTFFTYRGVDYFLTYNAERENWQVRRGGEQSPFFGGIPRGELRVRLLRVLAVERQRLINA